MKTGYIETYDESKSRTQVIVIVREDLTVLCYDESLELMWQKEVAHKAFEIEKLIGKFSVSKYHYLRNIFSISIFFLLK